MKPIDAIERDLCATYAHEVHIYTQALTLAEQISTQVGQGADSNELLERIAELLAEVGMLEHEAQNTRERWRREAAHPGPELHGHLSHIATLIQKMQTHLAGAMHSAAEHKRTLTADLDDAARRGQGCRAYGAARWPR